MGWEGRLRNAIPHYMLTPYLRRLLCLMAFLAAPLAFAHPIPDVPVRFAFEEGGAFHLQVEVDPRCFDGDPEIAPSLLNSALKALPEDEKAAMLAQAKDFAARSVEFTFVPSGVFTPEFTFEFTTHNAQPLTKDDDIVVMTGNWRSTVPAGSTGYRIHAKPEGKLSVLFLNRLRGKEVDRMNVLFPKETSFLLDLVGKSHELPPEPASGTSSASQNGTQAQTPVGTAAWVKKGFLHVVPKGLSTILFVVALFLLGRALGTLVPQVLAFMGAHSLALWMDTMGWLHVPASIAQPAIAVGIVVLALANIFQTRCTLLRLALVLGFGLFHGFGFAEVFAASEVPAEALSGSLVGFNVGLEAGVCVVVIAALIATFWAGSAKVFRWVLTIPGSLVIAVLALWTLATKMGWIGA
jgi:hypothetical protein